MDGFEDNNLSKSKYEPNLPPNSTSLDNIKRRNTVVKIYRDEILPLFLQNSKLSNKLIVKPISNSRFIFSQRLIQNNTPKDFNVSTDKENNILTITPILKEAIVGDEIVCDNCGWHWPIADGGDDLHICHKCGYDNTPSKENHENGWNLKKGVVSLTKYMIDNGMNIKPFPKIKVINDDVENAKKLLGYTAYYNPCEKSITLYTLGRHPKDIISSFCHEMIHHMQNLEGRLNNINTSNILDSEYLKGIEREAYELGGLLFRQYQDFMKKTTFRNWEDKVKNNV